MLSLKWQMETTNSMQWVIHMEKIMTEVTALFSLHASSSITTLQIIW